MKLSTVANSDGTFGLSVDGEPFTDEDGTVYVRDTEAEVLSDALITFGPDAVVEHAAPPVTPEPVPTPTPTQSPAPVEPAAVSNGWTTSVPVADPEEPDADDPPAITPLPTPAPVPEPNPIPPSV